MLLKQNKVLLVCTLAVLGVWGAVHMLFVQDRWAEAASKMKAADEKKATWEKNFKDGDNLLPKPDAEKELKKNKDDLNANLTTLQKIEFGAKDTLREYNEASAGAGDHKNYLLTKRTTLHTRAKDALAVTLPPDLGMVDKISDDPVSLNLFRVAILDSFIKACNKAGVQRVLRLQHFPPKFVRNSSDEAPADSDAASKEDSAKDEKKAEPGGDRLVKFDTKIEVLAPERAFGKLLFELQKPTENGRGYLCLRGFHVSVKDAASGMVDGVVAVSGLLSEKTIKELGIPVKEDARRGGESGGGPDFGRGY